LGKIKFLMLVQDKMMDYYTKIIAEQVILFRNYLDGTNTIRHLNVQLDYTNNE